MWGDRLKRVRKVVKRQRQIYIEMAFSGEEFSKIYKVLKEEFRESLHLPPRSSSVKKRRTHPLINASFFLRLVLSKQELEIVEGDLLESYEKNLKDLGQKRASWLMYKQVAVSVWPFVKRLLYKVGAIAWVTQAVRRLIGG